MIRRIGVPVLVALLIGGTQACGRAQVPLDTLPGSSSQAGDLASSVASKARCGSLEQLDAAGTQGTWHFTCQRGTTTFAIVVFGGDGPRQAGLKALQDAGRPFVARAYYAVTVPPSGPSKADALASSPSGPSKADALASSPSPSALDPFR